MMKIGKISLVVMLTLVVAGCLSPRADSPSEKRAAINHMSKTTLQELYQQKPSAQGNIDGAYGYAVFSNVNAQYFLIGGGGGYGVAVAHADGRKTYMRMAQAGVGIGLGVQDIRVVFVFHTRQAFDEFIHRGWEFGGQADLAAKAEDKGASVTGEFSISTEIDIYTMTESGLVAKVNLAGSKYWQAVDLN